jgi:Spy/CpxP family protein refolding chaperone
MRTLIAVLTLVVGLAISPRFYADEPKTADEGVGEGLAERIQDLNLTDEQETKIADIRKECRPKVEEAAKELGGLVKEEVEKVRGVLTPEQKEKLQTLRQERHEQRLDGLACRLAHLRDLHLTEAEMNQVADIRKEFRPKIMQAMEGFRGVLTDEQKKAREEALKAGKSRREILVSLNLTDEQKQKVEGACKEMCSTVREEMEKIRDVLSPEQQAQLGDFKDERREHARDRMACAIHHFQELNLTDEQMTKIADIRKEFRPRIHEAANKLRSTVREEVGMILTAIKG